MLKVFFNEVGSMVKYRLNFKNHFFNHSGYFILGYIIDMLLVFKEVKFGYGTDMDSGDMFFICSCTGKYQF